MKHEGNLIITKYNAAGCVALTSVGGDLCVEAYAQLPALTSVGGDLYVWAYAQLPALTSVGGDLHVWADAQLPALTSVGGDLYVWADAQLPALTSVGGDLSVKADAQLPALTPVGGDLYVEADGKIDAPLLAINGEKYTEIDRSYYGLFAGDKGHYRAGCRGPFTADEALAHWDRADERAVIFTAAIKKHMGEAQ